jgi:hypothetical protein
MSDKKNLGNSGFTPEKIHMSSDLLCRKPLGRIHCDKLQKEIKSIAIQKCFCEMWWSIDGKRFEKSDRVS